MSRTVLITGANRGIGFQASKELAAAGHKILMTGRSLEKVTLAAKEVQGEVIPLKLDVTDEASIKSLVTRLQADNVQLNALVNNAGSVFEHMRMEIDTEQPFDTSVNALRQTLDLNLIGPYELTQALFPFFDRNQRVDIVNVSSGMGSLDEMGVGVPAYRISKTGINALTAWLAAEMKDTKFHINSVCPGWVKTDLGGPNATRELTEGVVGIKWLIDEKPDISGKFIRDKEVIAF